jgi:FkbM family methyltransferase
LKSLINILTYIGKHPLSGRHKLKAFVLLMRWQLTQWLMPYPVEYPFIGKTKLLIKKGMTGATGNIYTGLHEFADMGFLLHFLRKDDLFFDIGANVGSYTILASGCKGARSVSIEPVPSTFEWLKKNIAVNDLHEMVRPYNIGMGGSKAVLHFTKTFDTVNHVVLNPNAKDAENLIAVHIESFDAIAETEGIPALVKIDAEGFETEVLQGMAGALQSTTLKAIIIELNGSGLRYGYDEKLIHDKLVSNNFSAYQYFPFERRLDLLETYGNLNTIYIKDIDFVKTRIEASDKINLFSESF